MANTVLTPDHIVRPEIEPGYVIRLTKHIFGLDVLRSTELNSYDDRNFHIHVLDKTENEHIPKISSDGYVLKVLNSLDSKYEIAIDAQNCLITYLSDRGINTPRPLKTVDNSVNSYKTVENGGKHIVRLFEYLPGRILAGIPYTKDILYQSGQLAGRLDKYCQDFHHAGFDNYKRIWSLTEVPKLQDFLCYIDDLERRSLFEVVINTFINKVVSKYDKLGKGLIHGDFNEQNILVNKKQDGHFYISGILDFGDSAYSFYVFEIAITMCHLMLESTLFDPLETGGYTLAGFLSEFSLKQADLHILKECICARLVQSLIMGTYSTKKHPENAEYFLLTSKKGWKLLSQIWNTPKKELNDTWLKCLTECDIKSALSELVTMSC